MSVALAAITAVLGGCSATGTKAAAESTATARVPSAAVTSASASASPTPSPTAAPTHQKAAPRPTPTPNRSPKPKPAPTPEGSTYAGLPLPNSRLTPGEVFTGITAAAVCTPGWSSEHRDVSTAERHSVFAAYGIPYSQHSAYELDHLIPLEVGGDNSTDNLWPEPQTENDSSGPDKDALENHLHALVCSGQVSLAAAQQAVAHNWVTAWDRYQGTSIESAPEPTHTTAASQSPAPSAPQTSTPPPAATVVHPGAFCAPEGATGVTDRGTSMVCGPASDGRNRWHHS
jgi:hypothetical protein